MGLVVGLPAGRAERTRPHTGQRLSRQRGVALDCLAIVELHVADPIDVDRGPPAVRRRSRVHRVSRRPISPIRRDVDEGAHGVAKALETEREHGDTAWDITWKTAQRSRFAHVGLDQLPEPVSYTHLTLPTSDLV